MSNSATAELSRKAQEAAAAALASPFARRITESLGMVTNKKCDNSDGFAFLDNMCGPMMEKFRNAGDDDDDSVVDGRRGGRGGRSRRDRGSRRPQGSYEYDDDETEYTDDDDTTYADGGTPRRRRGGRNGRGRGGRSVADDESNYTGYTGYTDDDTLDNNTVSTYDQPKSSRTRRDDETYDSAGKLIQKPLASGFAKRCYFTKAGIGRTTQHYEGLTLTGNTILMLASAMNLKGCPTICDEDLRRVEQTFPNQFSRLPDELLLSSGWRRISKYCHFSHKQLPDGVPFFHSRKRCHPSGGFYFLLCSAVGMVRLIDVEPLSRDALILLQTDFPLTCEKAPQELIEDPNQWTLVNKFCFFSGGPINVEEDVYYRAELSGNEIYMLAFLSPTLSPEELYRLKESPNSQGDQENTGPLKTVKAVEEVESVYNLTNQDFDDLKLYHMGPCRALPPHLLNPEAWAKVLPPPFATAREEALMIAHDWESRFPPAQPTVSVPTPALVEEKKVESISSGYVEFGETGQMKQPSVSQEPIENHYQQPQMHQQYMSTGTSHEYPSYPPGQMHQPMVQDQNEYSSQYPGQMHQPHGMMQDPNGHYQPPATYPSQYQPQQYDAPPMENYPRSNSGEMVQSSYDQGTQQSPMPQMEMEMENPQPPPQLNNYVREVEEGAGWDQPHDEAYIPNPRANMMRGLQVDPEDFSSSKIRVDPPDAGIEDDASLTSSTAGGSRLKQLAMKRMEAQLPNRSLASKLAAKRAMLLADDEDDATVGDSTIATSLVSDATTDFSVSEKNSRRALILQMAKARMKSLQKEKIAEDPAEGKAEGRNESPPASSAAPEDEELETPRDEISPGGGVSGELSTGMSGLELD
mmetsp:Transcript_6811/g.14213  ORF Transcript_6811/g.14213 Transcript_6811/m.14213 type:complete len:862 (-) Transcript_6811:126-2711(-)|eukprot:CAMPEP_0113405256 /NCGR_PEP_ID=MMETSP0013_2-20120614/18851_1 /TAXON_ID=2843 ORGANISM="Skeletonema costatum, Strain 1716" /NCGR_SAMPLE_ID=MMETSP0013_2 /ASSEMBLY_ACC=CAM_ASM_000158 /LENGTH=861 /DNA_ID=CAMNT_0000290963 /DNA_START=191 /DNA_END=2776 /DNA_ORIENTATION=+ /assembly_acc=CAM_ASM_000158